MNHYLSSLVFGFAYMVKKTELLTFSVKHYEHNFITSEYAVVRRDSCTMRDANLLSFWDVFLVDWLGTSPSIIYVCKYIYMHTWIMCSRIFKKADDKYEGNVEYDDDDDDEQRVYRKSLPAGNHSSPTVKLSFGKINPPRYAGE